jgi:hypothetical protein
MRSAAKEIRLDNTGEWDVVQTAHIHTSPDGARSGVSGRDGCVFDPLEVQITNPPSPKSGCGSAVAGTWQ